MNQQDTAQLQTQRRAEAPLHGPEAFAAMRRAGRLVAEGLDLLVENLRPGVTSEFLDRLAFEFAMDHGAYPATLFYRGYTKSICTSINHVVCHGIPSDKPLREGDILNIDYTVILDGWHGDSSRMFFVGEVPRRAARLCDITYEALLRGIAVIRPGGRDERHRRRDPELRRERALLGGARLLRPRARPRLPRRADDPALRRAVLQRPACGPACCSRSSR